MSSEQERRTPWDKETQCPVRDEGSRRLQQGNVFKIPGVYLCLPHFCETLLDDTDV